MRGNVPTLLTPQADRASQVNLWETKVNLCKPRETCAAKGGCIARLRGRAVELGREAVMAVRSLTKVGDGAGACIATLHVHLNDGARGTAGP